MLPRVLSCESVAGPFSQPTRIYRFGPYELDVRSGELRKHGIRIRVREQPIKILFILLENPGEVVLREEIRDRLWPGNTIVEFDHGINAAVQKLRDGLGESADQPRYVETVARRGYRFIADVERIAGNLTAAQADPSEGGEGQVEAGEPLLTDPAATNEPEAAAAEDFAPGTVEQEHRRPRGNGGIQLWIAFTALAAALIAGAFALAYFTRKPSPAPVVRFSFAAPANWRNAEVAVSPDGTRVAFGESGGRSGLWIRSIDSFNAQLLPGTEGAIYPFWSPDGTSIGFMTRNGIKRVDFHDGGQSTVQQVTSAALLYGGAAWNRQGDILFQPQSTGSGLFRVPAGGGTPTPVTSLNAARQEIAHRFPQFLPDGRHFIYWVWSALEENTGVYAGSLDASSSAKPMDAPLVRSWRHALFAEPGYLLIPQGSALLARRFDPSTLRITGEPHPYPEPIGMDWGLTGRAMFSISANGALVYQEAAPQQGARIILRDRRGIQLRAIPAPPGSQFPSLDPREKNAVINGVDENSMEEMWRIDLDRGISSRLTAAHGSNQAPRWSPDGSRIAFRSNRSGAYDLYAKTIAGSGPEQLLVKSPNLKFPMSWSSDGRFLFYYELDPVTKWDLWVLPLEGDRKPISLLKTEFNEIGGFLSPIADSQGHSWLAYSSDETGSSEVYLRPFQPGSPSGPLGDKVRVSTGGGSGMRWRKDGRELFYFERQTLMAVDVKLGDALELGVPHKLFDALSEQYAVFGDGQRFLFVEPDGEIPVPKINVVLNWISSVAAGNR